MFPVVPLITSLAEMAPSVAGTIGTKAVGHMFRISDSMGTTNQKATVKRELSILGMATVLGIVAQKTLFPNIIEKGLFKLAPALKKESWENFFRAGTTIPGLIAAEGIGRRFSPINKTFSSFKILSNSPTAGDSAPAISSSATMQRPATLNLLA